MAIQTSPRKRYILMFDMLDAHEVAAFLRAISHICEAVEVRDYGFLVHSENEEAHFVMDHFVMDHFVMDHFVRLEVI